MKLRTRQLVASALLTLQLGGCATWRPARVSPIGAGGSEGAFPTAVRVQEVDEDSFWAWVDEQKWYIALAAVIVATVLVLTWGDDCAPTDQYCRQ